MPSTNRNAKPPIAVGDRFGRLTVLCDSGERKNGYIVWKCRCDCGNEILVDKRTLERGTVLDCGCTAKVNPRQKDITGKRFGKLTALYCTDARSAYGDTVWHCICDCGREIDVRLHQLQSGYRKSCGCLSHPKVKELVGKRFGRLIVIEYAGKKDGVHRWRCRCDCGNEVVVSQSHLQSGKTKSCGCMRADVYVKNMKLVGGTSIVALETSKNRLRSTNTSGCTGVYWSSSCGRWYARIGFCGKSYYLGSYKYKEDAIKARKSGEEVHDNFIEWYYNEYLPSENNKSQPEK
ncbi:MAG: transcriptional regulator [Oscillospiraceae bacterium]|nr:transcriptional regulator [Oscillospiraceae bacterium]